MPYQSTDQRLPSEKASKLGHLTVIESDWVRSLVNDFENLDDSAQCVSNIAWVKFPHEADALTNIWAVDGSHVVIQSGSPPQKELAYIKTALLRLDKSKIDKIDKKNPHPLQMKRIMDNSALFHSTVLPLNNIRTSKGSNYNSVRNIIFESIKIDENGQYYETLKWLVYEKWLPGNDLKKSPNFDCPHCDLEIAGFLFDEDKMKCPHCNKEVLLTDMLGFHLDMNEESASHSIVSSYMLIVETLMLFTPIRLFWNYQDLNLISNVLFIKDGPLSLSSQYSKIVPLIRDFLQFASDQRRPVHIIGCEKSGKFFDHLMSIRQFSPPLNKENTPCYSVLSHGYIVDEVQRRPRTKNQYGSRTNWGEKVYVKLEPNTCMVLNIPTGNYNNEDVDFPKDSDIIGLARILATIPALISRKYEGALYPIALVNGIASMSNYPSAKILEHFTESNIRRC
ncbi:hypothetical protein [Methanolapillus millepedarum]|uniref:NurA domain-containing protein n=1 Tax=Methanolapillus millepedarum TaxID=3028296 RepID=A0AA96V4A7_9EURY|nr:hypothetical protein MsAc7_10180 [Methanosarcinaceae archaeon Ac7]